jgi:hypothetical protein
MAIKNKLKKKTIAKQTIIRKSFYIEAYSDATYFPEGILRLYRMTRALVTPIEREFTYQSVRIKNPEELASVKIALDWLAGKLKWQDLPPMLEEFKKQMEMDKEQESIPPETLKLVRQYPEASIAIMKTFDTVFHGQTEIEDFPTVRKFIDVALNSLANQTKNMTEAKISLFEQLDKETSIEGINKLSKLMEEYDLPQLTSVASIITDRLQRIKLLEATIQSENAYEIKGKDSVFNQLKNAFWILNDSYWLLQANETLKNFLEGKCSREDEKKRPDFICANDAHQLIIIELKRPKEEVTVKNIDQLEEYLVTSDEFKGDFTSKQGFLIAKCISPKLQKIIAGRMHIQFKSYFNLVDDCKRRYQEYNSAMEHENKFQS